MSRSWILLPGRGFARDGVTVTVFLGRAEIWARLHGGHRVGGHDLFTLDDGTRIRAHWHLDGRLDALVLSGCSLLHEGMELLAAPWSMVCADLAAAGHRLDNHSRRLQGHDCPDLRICFVLPHHYGGVDDDRVRQVEFWQWSDGF